MSMWLIVLGVLAILAVTGYYQGAIRSMVSLIGLFFALMLSLPLSPPLRPLVAKVGLTNPIWAWVLPPVVVFALFVLVFGGLGFFVHYKVALYFKYKTDDYVRLRWERLNQRLGVSIGLVAGAIYSILVGVVIYIFGYVAVQVATDDSPAVLRLAATARQDLKDSGLDRTVAALDPMPEYFYKAVDVVGLVYRNNVLWNRVADYPPFLALAQRQEFQDIATDVELQGMLQTTAPFLNIINHPKVQAILLNPEIMQELKQVDLKDLYNYLMTAKSAKYEDEKILGRWKLDPYATLILQKKKSPDMPAQQMNRIKILVSVFLENVSMLATPDNKAILKMELGEQAKRMVAAVQAAQGPAPGTDENAAPNPSSPASRYNPYARYGNRMATPQAQPTQPVARPRPSPLTGIADVNLNMQGTWQRDGDKYKLSLQDEKQKSHAAEAISDEDRMLVPLDGFSLVFVR